jgi:hypothetical protein
MSAETKRPSFSNLLVLAAAFAASILVCLWVVAVEKSDAAEPHEFVLQTLASDFGPAGFVFLVWLASVLVLASVKPHTLPWVVAVSATLFVLLRVILHVLHPEVDPVRTPMSLYAQTSHGYLLAPTMVLWSGLILASAFHLTRVSRSPLVKQLTMAVVGVIVGSSVLGGIFPADPGQSMTSDAASLSASGMVHKVAGGTGFPLALVFPFLVLAQAWRSLEKAVRVQLLSLALAFPFVLAAALTFPDYGGLVQRMFILGYLAWLTLASFAVRRSCQPSA